MYGEGTTATQISIVALKFSTLITKVLTVRSTKLFQTKILTVILQLSILKPYMYS